MKSILAIIFTSILFGCASSNVTVRVPPPIPATTPNTVKVQVNDLRAPGVAASTREAAFGVPMGNVTFDPPEKQLVKDALDAVLSRQTPVKSNELYTCDIIEFGVNTKTTPLYWDVVGVVHLKLRHDGREQDLSGTHSERTYLWPGENIIGRVMQESLRKAVEGAQASP